MQTSDPGAAGTGVRKDIEAILQKSEKMLGAILESASQAILSVDRCGRIVLANARTEELFGYTENTVVHHGVLDPGFEFLGKPFTQESLAKKIREVLDGRGSGSAIE